MFADSIWEVFQFRSVSRTFATTTESFTRKIFIKFSWYITDETFGTFDKVRQSLDRLY